MKQAPKKRVKNSFEAVDFFFVLLWYMYHAFNSCSNELQISLFEHMVSKDQLIEAKKEEVSVGRNLVWVVGPQDHLPLLCLSWMPTLAGPEKPHPNNVSGSSCNKRILTATAGRGMLLLSLFLCSSSLPLPSPSPHLLPPPPTFSLPLRSFSLSVSLSLAPLPSLPHSSSLSLLLHLCCLYHHRNCITEMEYW